MSSDSEKNVFTRHLPRFAVDYCFQLWQEFNFHFKITGKRTSKLGDYKYDPIIDKHSISVNHNLNPYSFLITYIHEVAHLTTHLKYKNRVLPHGIQWKNEFKKLMLPLLNEKVFPDDVLRPLAHHMKNPKASSTSDKNLLMALRLYDEGNHQTLLGELDSGVQFLFNKKIYRKLEKRRTRSLCLEVRSNRKYLISESAAVKEFKNK